jgi:hypothetical protein
MTRRTPSHFRPNGPSFPRPRPVPVTSWTKTAAIATPAVHDDYAHPPCAQISTWLESPSLVPIGEGSTHWATLRALLTDGKVAGPLVHDARIAALCLASGVTERWILNRDFSHFPTLKTRNPLR